MRHDHNWIRKAKIVAEPIIKDAKKVASDLGYNDLKALMGLTTILFECSVCHILRTEEMLGKEVEIKKENKNYE